VLATNAHHYRPDIDGLRAVAVLAVVWFHASPATLSGGFAGVDVFFVISGYLISRNIFRLMDAGIFALSGFYVKRALRILPALLAVLSVSLLLGWLVLLPDEYASLGKHTFGGAVFVSNFLLLGEVGYFDKDALTKPLLHLWSLGIEEQFYVVWPLSLIAAWKLGANRAVLVIALLVLSFFYSIHSLNQNADEAFYLPLSRFWELMVGAVIASWHQSPGYGLGNRLSDRLRDGLGGRINNRLMRNSVAALFIANFLPVFGIIVIGICYLTAEHGVRFPGYWAMLPTLGAAAVILTDPQCWFSKNMLASKPLVFIGLISYPLYLWHWPLLAFSRIVYGPDLSPAITGLIVLGSLICAYLTYALLERPIRFGSHLVTKAVCLVLLTLLMGSVGLVIRDQHGFPDRPFIKEYRAITNLLEGPFWTYTTNDICTQRNPGEFRYFCTQSQDSPPEIILLGNSFANHLYAGLVGNKAFEGRSIMSYGSCEPGGDITECDRIEQLITANSTLRLAIISLKWPSFNEQGQYQDQDQEPANGDFASLPGVSADAYIEFLTAQIKFLQSKGINIVIFGPKAELAHDIRHCVPRPFRPTGIGCSVTRGDVHEQQKGIMAVFSTVLGLHPDVVFYDQNPLFCDTLTCQFVKNGLPLLRDGNGHYSQYGSELQIQQFVSWAKQNEPELLLIEASSRRH
jgi:peptidoglycan/LPS O-acetylase OafA/YrhL